MSHLQVSEDPADARETEWLRQTVKNPAGEHCGASVHLAEAPYLYLDEHANDSEGEVYIIYATSGGQQRRVRLTPPDLGHKVQFGICGALSGDSETAFVLGYVRESKMIILYAYTLCYDDEEWAYSSCNYVRRIHYDPTMPNSMATSHRGETVVIFDLPKGEKPTDDSVWSLTARIARDKRLTDAEVWSFIAREPNHYRTLIRVL